MAGVINVFRENIPSSLPHRMTGALSLQGETVNRGYSGGLTFTPAAIQNSYAAFFYHELVLGRLTVNAAVRYDLRYINPASNKLSATVGQIRDRNLRGWSGACGSRIRIYDGLSAGLNLMHSFRPPTIEELFSEGPHLAAYSYEVGNAALQAENGNGGEVFTEYKTERGHIHLSVYQNSFANYIFPVSTGRKSWRRADLYVYRFTGQPARFRGFEAVSALQLNHTVALNATLNYVEGMLTDSSQFLPQIPPLEGKLGLSGAWDTFSVRSDLRMAARQDHTGRFEEPTAAFAVIDLSAQYALTSGPLLHTLNLRVDNLLDSVYRKHLNRIKEVMPEAGRNIRLLYRIYF
jgi:iron complex outermembrane receptor protein